MDELEAGVEEEKQGQDKAVGRSRDVSGDVFRSADDFSPHLVLARVGWFIRACLWFLFVSTWQGAAKEHGRTPRKKAAGANNGP